MLFESCSPIVTRNCAHLDSLFVGALLTKKCQASSGASRGFRPKEVQTGKNSSRGGYSLFKTVRDGEIGECEIIGESLGHVSKTFSLIFCSSSALRIIA